MVCAGVTHCSKCGTPFRNGSFECEYCNTKKMIEHVKSKKKTSKEDITLDEFLNKFVKIVREHNKEVRIKEIKKLIKDFEDVTDNLKLELKKLEED